VENPKTIQSKITRQEKYKKQTKSLLFSQHAECQFRQCSYGNKVRKNNQNFDTIDELV